MRHSSLQFAGHRPWPMPIRPWVMAQTWSNLLFAHWRVPVAVLRDQIPDSLEIDLFEDEAWIGVVPFELRIRPRLFPVIPKVAAFPEINVRTYVTSNGKPGVWFFSLDATSPLAVRAARWGFNLPYFDARMSCRTTGDAVHYESRRTGTSIAANFLGEFEPTSDVFTAEAGSLEAWLTERYCLYAISKRGRVSRTEVHHAQWPLQHAGCRIEENTMTAPVGIDLKGEPLLHYARRIEVVNWTPQSLDSHAETPRS